LARGSPEAADRDQRAMRAAAAVVMDAKTQALEEFGEAMEKDFRLASRRFWQTIRWLRKGKQCLPQAVLSQGGGGAADPDGGHRRGGKSTLRNS